MFGLSLRPLEDWGNPRILGSSRRGSECSLPLGTHSLLVLGECRNMVESGSNGDEGQRNGGEALPTCWFSQRGVARGNWASNVCFEFEATSMSALGPSLDHGRLPQRKGKSDSILDLSLSGWRQEFK